MRPIAAPTSGGDKQSRHGKVSTIMYLKLTVAVQMARPNASKPSTFATWRENTRLTMIAAVTVNVTKSPTLVNGPVVLNDILLALSDTRHGLSIVSLAKYAFRAA